MANDPGPVFAVAAPAVEQATAVATTAPVPLQPLAQAGSSDADTSGSARGFNCTAVEPTAVPTLILRAANGDFVSLGDLSGNIGNQNYEIPVGVDLNVFNSVEIWCQRFSSGFGGATLSAS